MDRRERQRDPLPAPEAESVAGNGNLGSIRREGEELLSAGDSIIRNTLSADSEAFLRASRQQGGE